MHHCDSTLQTPLLLCPKVLFGGHRGPAHSHHQSLVRLGTRPERMATYDFTGTMPEEDNGISR